MILMFPTQILQVSSHQSLAVFLRPNQPFFTCVVAGTDGLTRRWNCGGGRVAQLGRSLDFPDERFSAGQVVVWCWQCCVARQVGDWSAMEGERTRCDPKCGQRDGAACALLEDDRLSMVLEAGVLEDDRLSMVLETDASMVDALCEPSACFWSW